MTRIDEELNDAELPALFDGLDVGVIVQGTHSEILYANRTALALLGLTRDQVLGVTSFDPSWDVVRPDGTPFPPEERPVALVLESGAEVNDVVLGVRRGGPERSWLLANAKPHRTDAGEITSVVVTLSDISSERRRMNLLQQVKDDLEHAVTRRTTELATTVQDLQREIEQREAAESALARSEARYRSILNAMAEGVAIHDGAGVIGYANPAAERILGLTLEHMQGRTIAGLAWALVRPNGVALRPEEHPVEITRTTGKACEATLVGILRPDGSKSWLLVNTDPLETESSFDVAVVATYTDVTPVREATMALAQSRTKFQQVTEAVPGVLYQATRRADRTFDLHFISPQLREMFGLDPEEVKPDAGPLFARLDAEGARIFEETVQEAQRTSSIWECEVRLRGKDGSWQWIRNRAIPEPVEGGVMWSGMLLDVTEERKLADQVRVARTREAIGSVTAGIAHNFNNALAVIVPNLEETLEAVPEENRQPLEESLQSAHSAAALVKQLMLVARGTPSERREPVEMVTLVQGVASLSRRIFQGRVLVEERITADQVRVNAQPATLRQVLLNICINARDALHGAGDGRVIISLSIQGRRSPTPTVRISVEDNGCGMDDATVRRLGEPFFTTKPPDEGTGLGLATAYATFRDLGGDITCESVLGEGSEFIITLPVHDFVGPEAVVPSTSRPIVIADPESTTPRRLLVIDDETLVRKVLRKVLSKRGFEVEEAENGTVGLSKISDAQAPYHLVVLDLSMPGLSGEEVLERLRSSHPSLPVVILSGFVEDPDRVASANAVLNKPISSRVLVDTIEGILG